MKKLVIAGVVATLSFVGGLVGLYHLVPFVAPERAAEARQYVDSLAAAGLIGTPDSTAVLAAGALLPDASALDTTLGADPLPAALADSTAAADAALPPIAATLADSVAALQTRLLAAERERDALRTRLDARGQQQARTDAQVSELAGTLTALEDKELGAILAQLDIAVVRALYDRTSARNRTRLLKAMAPERAARFVQQLVEPDHAGERPAASEPTAAVTRQ